MRTLRAINSILDNISKQTEECRSQLASIISAHRLRECQAFVDKVGEIRFTKVKQRQLNKYNILLNKKEGNITRANATTPTNSNNSTNSNNLASQEGRQASASPPPGEGSTLSQAGRQAGTLLPSREGSNLSQAGSQVGTPQETVHIPSGEGSSSSQATAHLPPREGSSISQAIAHLPSGEGSNSPPAIAHLPPR